ncbi:MAG TPA: NAD(P)H-quinone oxidoreductase [Gemmatimonadaceae bacterium]|nr:NAD(P)H-quinone oxidoreductase [Gemmatimonadaceae bacterium]
MRAAVITSAGDPDVLELRDVPRPAPGVEQVLVRVRASALNRADLLQRRGGYAAPPGWPSDIPGIELAGEITAVGSGATLWQVGDRVFGLAGGGAHAEYCVLHERTLARVPAGLSWVQAAAIPEAFITAHDALATQAVLRAGERVLIHAVGSGVGLAAVQLSRALGALPYGTARTADKLERARALGLEDGAVILGDAASLDPHVARWTGGRGFEVVLDLVGGAYVPASIAALAHRGRLMLVGLMAGASAHIDLGRILRHRLTIRGTVLRSRPLEERIAVTRAFAAEVVPLLESGALTPVIDSTFDLADIRAAHARLESNATFGKVVVEV